MKSILTCRHGLAALACLTLALAAGCSKTTENQAKNSDSESTATAKAAATTVAKTQPNAIEPIAPTEEQISALKLDYKPVTPVSTVAAVILPSVGSIPTVEVAANGPGTFELTMEQQGCKGEVQVTGTTAATPTATANLSDTNRRIEFSLTQGEQRKIGVHMESTAMNNWNCNVAIRKIG